MTTFGQLTDSTLMYLHGFTGAQNQETHLRSSLSASATTMNIADGTAISRGLVEIDDELLYVESSDALTATIAPYGRGYRGTTSASHATYSRVTSTPLFPRSLVKNALNEAIRSVFPLVSAVHSASFAYSPAISTYALPAGTQSVLSVSWQTVGPSKEWMPVRQWRLDSSADPGAFPTGATLSLYDAITPGRTVRVVYMTPPTELSADSDDFTDTGLTISCEDVVRLGAAWRMVVFLDSPHLSGMSAEADFASNQRPVGGSAQLSRVLLQQYQIRLQEEARRQQALYPVRSHSSR